MMIGSKGDTAYETVYSSLTCLFTVGVFATILS